MKKSDYVKQIEDANAELQRKLDDQCKVSECLQEAYDHMTRATSQHQLVIITNQNQPAHKIGDVLQVASLVVEKTSVEEWQKVRDKYNLKKEMLLFKSIKDRFHKQGSIYDVDMLADYARGRGVKPYVI
jgi:frataxin-like iron-binding protein CyaY